MNRSEILQAASDCVNGQREQDYGSPEDNFQVIADLWSTYKSVEFSPVDVAMMMALMKIARIRNKGGTGDSFVDLAGYAACGGEIASKANTDAPEADAPKDPIIYAVDFDGTLCENIWPEIGQPNIPLINFLKSEQEKGAKVILWTMREGTLLWDAIKWLSEYNFQPDVINDNTPEMKAAYGNNPRKVFANVYIDDHNAKIDYSRVMSNGI